MFNYYSTQLNLFKCFWLNIKLGKITKFLKLNIITLKLNYHYKYNIYLLLFIFICVISSIIVRSNIINVELLYYNYYINIIIHVLFILSVIYALKLIFDIIKRCIQAYKIIPDFIKWYNNDVKDIKYIITLYYIQNIFFILLSCWILFIMFSKLNTFIDGIYLFIIGFGVISSLVFLHYYPIKDFNLNTNMRDYSIWVYLFILLFIIFYILILPLIIINVVNSDKFILFLNNIIDDYRDFCKIEGHYMDTNNTTNSDNTTPRTVISNNTVISSNNKVSIPVSVSDNASVTNNSLTTSDNTVEIRSVPNQNSSNYHIGTINVTHINPPSSSSIVPVSVPLIGNITDNVLPAYSSSPSSLPLDSTVGNNDNLTQSPQLKDDNLIEEVIRSIPDLHFSDFKKDILSNNIVDVKVDDIKDNSIKDLDIKKDSNKLLKKNMLLKTRKSFVNLFNIKKSLGEQNSVVLPASSKNVSDDNILLLDNNKNKSVIKLNSNKGDGFKRLRHFKSEGNIGNLLNKKIIIKSYNFPFNNSNVFIIPINLYESLIISTNNLLSSLQNNPYNSCFITAYDYLNNIIKYATLNKEVQSNLIDMIHNNKDELRFFKLLNDRYLIDYEMSKLEDNNIKYNNILHYHLKDYFNNKIDNKTLKCFNVDSLKEFYVLNDFNYLNSKSKYNINLTLLNNLFASRMEIENMINIMKLDSTLINKDEFIILEKDYKLFYNNYDTFYHQFNKHTMDLYNDRYYNDGKYISVNNIKKSREIYYFQYLFNQFN